MSILFTSQTKRGYRLGKSYLSLLKRFPLLAIRSEEEYDRATAVAQDLIGRDDLDGDQSRYLDTIITLISAYEAKEYDFDRESLSPLEALRTLLEANDMNAADLGRVIGSQPYASMILAGKRQISKDNAKKLAHRFKVDAGLFI
jgi:HTH-type transcriptional regulator/antitoxin HigA